VAGIERRHAGYIIAVEPDLVDLHRFRRLVERARETSCGDGERAAILAEALSLWRGRPLAALSGEWVTRVRAGWRRQRLDAAVLWAETEQRLGHTAEVIDALAELTTDYPHAEPLEGLLMRGLHEAGRDAEAIDRYTVFRRRLADELGADPSDELRELHRALLRGELPAPPPSDRAVPVARARVSPAQLPPAVFFFAGRDAELNHLDNLLAPTGSVVMIVMDRTAGVGKTGTGL
jgi:DNA-binding SARP family transcriptional activator